jgi:hypothetical protein
MAKGLNEKIINIETPWSGYSGSRVEEFIKNEITTLESEKMGYVAKDINGHFKFYATKEDADNNINVLGVVETTPQYALSINEFGDNKKIFLSNESEKKFVWGFKTLDTVLKDVYREDVSVDYIITNGINTKKITTIITNNPDSTNDNFTLVELDLNEMLDNGTSKLNIEIRGVKTNIKQVLSAEFSIITLDVEDATNFSSPFNNLFIPTIKVTCTNLQKYYIEYRIDGGKFNDVNRIEGEGKGYQTTTSPNINIESISNGRHVFEYRIAVKLDTNINAFYTNINRIEFIKGDINISEPQILISTTYSEGEEIIDTDGNLIINNLTQYVPFDLKYAVYNGGASTNVEFHEIGEVSGETISVIKNTADNNKVCNYAVQSLTSGTKIVKIFTTANDIEKGEYITNGDGRKIYFNIKPSNLMINICNTNLRVDFNSNGKSNDAVDKKEWVSKVDVYTNSAKFNNEFDWSQGWTNNGLVISDNCEVKFDYAPFPKQNDSDSEELKKEWVGGLKGYTFEIEFMTQNVTDENAVVCDMTYNGCGFKITGSQFIFTTPQKNSVSTRFKSDEMNRIALVIRPYTKNVDGKDTFNKGLIELYVNGELSNIAKYTELEKFEVVETVDGKNISKPLTFRGANGADIVIKYIRAYNGVVSADELVNNYILFRSNSSKMLSLYNDNNILDDNGNVTYDTIRKIGNIPFIIFVGRTVESELASGDGNQYSDEPYSAGTINANSNNWYETLENTTNKKLNIDMDVIYVNPLDPMKNFKFVKAYITPQGTSSMYYPKKNYRIYTQKNKDTRMFVSSKEAGILDLDRMLTSNFGEKVEDRVFEIHRGVKNYKKRLYSFKDNAQAVKCWCLKADFAETSSSHNTGVARLWGDTLKKSTIKIGDGEYSVFKTTAQSTIEKNYNNNIKGDMPDIRTTIDGFPIVVFGAKSYGAPFKFLGQYNFNNDKSTESVFGFCDIDNDSGHLLTNSYINYDTEESGSTGHTLDAQLDKYMTCVETLDNGNILANFAAMNTQNASGETISWDDAWEDAFEFRYPEMPEKPSAKDYKDGDNWKDGGEEEYEKDLKEYNEEILPYWKNTHLKPFKHFAQWLYDLRWCDVNGQPLDGVSDWEERRDRFATEKWEHLDVWKMAAYYIYAMRFGAVDQIVKNSMLTSEGPFAYNKDAQKYGFWDATDVTSENYGKHYKWYYINYDNDTVMGVKNDGSLAYGPDILRTSKDKDETYIYAGSNSTLWNCLDADEEFQNIVRIADQGISNIMTYSNTINMFDVEQVGKWCERLYNKDAEYKYISPYISNWEYSGDTQEVFADKLYMLQGSRTAHRHWWLSKRFNLFDGKWNSGEFATKYIEVKCNYGAIDDTFGAKAGSDAYFGYQINNKTFGNGAKDGGTSYEYKSNEEINWKLYKVIQIGDPIAIYGSTDMLELNLGGLSKNLTSLAFYFGKNTDIKNKLEVLNLSIPEDLLKQNISYEAFADELSGTTINKTSLEKLQEKYDYVTEEQFTNGTYKTYEESDIISGITDEDFYRVVFRNDDNTIKTYTYFAKQTGGVRNYACTDINFDSLDKLQELYIAGYMGLNSIVLNKNLYINKIDARYSNIGSINISTGSRIKELKASSALKTLSFNSCGNIKLSNITIDDVLLYNDGGKNISEINIVNSDGLNHAEDFKNFIFKWINGGKEYVAVNDKKLTLIDVEWHGIGINDIITLLNFSESAQFNISGRIEMSNENISRENMDIIDAFKAKYRNVEIIIPTNIMINVPEGENKITCVAGETIEISVDIYPGKSVVSENNGIVAYSFVKEISSSDADNVEGEMKDPNTGKIYIKIDDSEVRNNISLDKSNPKYEKNYSTTLQTDEEVIGKDSETFIAVMLTINGITKFDVVPLIIKDPTYAQKCNISGNLNINELNHEYIYKLELTDQDGEWPIGTVDIDWELSDFNGNYNGGLTYIASSAVSDDNRTLTIKTNGDTPDLIAKFNISANITNYNGTEAIGVSSRTITVLNENIIMTKETNPVVLNICSGAGWVGDTEFMTKEEASNVESLGTHFANVKSEFTFNEIEFFTSLTGLTDGAFANSNLTEIKLCNNIKVLGKSVFEGCKKLTNINFVDSEIAFIPEKAFLNCTSLRNIVLPDSVQNINANAFGGVGFKNILFSDEKQMIEKTLYISLNSNLTIIKNNAFETTNFVTNGTINTTNILEEVSLPSKFTFSPDDYNFLLSSKLKKVNLHEDILNIRNENNVVTLSTTLIRVIPLNETNEKIELLDLSSIQNVYPYAFYGCDIVDEVKFGNDLTGYGLEVGAFYNSNIKKVNLGDTNVQKLYEYTFNKMPLLNEVILPQNGSLTTLGHHLFVDCPMLTSIELPDSIITLETQNNNGYTFVNCGFTDLKLPKYTKLNISNIISKCTSLESVTLPIFTENSKGVIEIINDTIFWGEGLQTQSFINTCEKLNVFRQNEYDTNELFCVINGVIYQIGYVYNDIVISNDNLKVISVPFNRNDYENILNDISFKDNTYCVNEINNYAFFKTNIENIIVPNTVINIGDGAFASCEKLQTAVLSNKINSISTELFNNCKELRTLIIPSNITEIGFSSFAGCVLLSNIIILSKYAPSIKSYGIRKINNTYSYYLSPFGYTNYNIIGINSKKQNILYLPYDYSVNSYNDKRYAIGEIKTDESGNNYFEPQVNSFQIEFDFETREEAEEKLNTMNRPELIIQEVSGRMSTPLFNEKLSNFKKEYLALNSNTNSEYVTLNVYKDGQLYTDTIYLKSDSGNLIFTENGSTYSSTYSLNTPEGYKIYFDDNVYHNEPIYVYSDSECMDMIGEFIAKYGVNEYTVGELLMGNSRKSSMFSTTLFGAPVETNTEVEMANITKKEYEALLSRVNQMAEIINKLKK